MAQRLSDQAATSLCGLAAGSRRLSVILITHNEESNIAACLASVAFADEVIVVDNASTDATAALAQATGAAVVQVPDWPGFGPQKNRALDRATGDWVFSIDADERVSPELARAIQDVVAADGPAPSYKLPRDTQFCGQWIRHCGWTPDHVLRLFRRGTARFTDDLVHERLLPQEPAATALLSQPLQHYSYPTPNHYWRKLQQYSQAWAAQRHARGQKTSMLRAALASVVAFMRSYFFRLGFLDGAMGFAVCTMQAQAAFGKYFALYCLNRQDDTKKTNN
ncbi:glycosyltransferase family 2 protein [soil metagenome]